MVTITTAYTILVDVFCCCYRCLPIFINSHSILFCSRFFVCHSLNYIVGMFDSVVAAVTIGNQRSSIKNILNEKSSSIGEMKKNQTERPNHWEKNIHHIGKKNFWKLTWKYFWKYRVLSFFDNKSNRKKTSHLFIYKHITHTHI